MSLPPLPRWICGGYKVAGKLHPCGRVVQQGEPGGRTVTVMCCGCRAEWEREYPRAQVRGEKATARRIGRGFGAGDGDAFR